MGLEFVFELFAKGFKFLVIAVVTLLIALIGVVVYIFYILQNNGIPLEKVVASCSAADNEAIKSQRLAECVVRVKIHFTDGAPTNFEILKSEQ